MDLAAAPPEALSPSAMKLSELIGALSHALDITEGQPAGHCVRCCWIGMHIGRAIGLPQDQLWELYYTLLLKDLGCSSNAARICELYLADDLGFKRDFKTVGDSLPQVLSFVLTHTGLKAGLAERFRSVMTILKDGPAIAQDLIATRCQRGAEIARLLRFPDGVAEGIYSLDEHFNGQGKPARLAGEAIPVHARIALLAQVIDVFHTAGGREVALDDDYLDDIAAAFGQVVDAKSPYTSGHSARVALYTDMIGEALGLPAQRRRWLRRGALLHDVGKLGVSNSVLDKAGALDRDEWEAVRLHAAYTETILGRIGAFAELAAIAGSHHERLDGAGYPRGLRAEDIRLETRIITTADIFDAITAARPYRGAIPVPQALEMMEKTVGTALDPACFAALKQAVARVPFPV